MTKEALIKWYDSGAENRDEFITLVEQALAQQEPNPWSEAVTDQENEKFSMDVSTFSGADPEATKYALEQFLRNRAKEQPAQEPVMYQYRRTNPGDNKDVSKSDFDWHIVEVRHPADNIESRIEELESSRYNGKPCYEVRGLFAHHAPTQPAQEPCGYLDEFGNFEPAMLPWMQEEPGVAWEAVYKQAQMLQLGEACAAVCERTPKMQAYGNNRAVQDECAAAIRKLIKEMLPSAELAKQEKSL